MISAEYIRDLAYHSARDAIKAGATKSTSIGDPLRPEYSDWATVPADMRGIYRDAFHYYISRHAPIEDEQEPKGRQYT